MKNKKNFKLSYESDGKMDKNKSDDKKNKNANFFNTTPQSE